MRWPTAIRSPIGRFIAASSLNRRPARAPPSRRRSGTRRLPAFPRSAVKVQAQWFPNPAGDEWVAVITTGVNLIIDGMQTAARWIFRRTGW